MNPTDRILTFQGDAYDLAKIAVVAREGRTVYVYSNGNEFEYKMKHEAFAKSQQEWLTAQLKSYHHEREFNAGEPPVS